MKIRGTDYRGKKIGCLSPESFYTNRSFKRVWVCRCDCGKHTHVEARNLKRYPKRFCEHQQLALPVDTPKEV